MKKYFWLFIALFFSPLIFAYNESFLNYSPVFYFTKEDTAIFNATKNKALENAKDGQKISWRNPKTGSNGYFIPSNTTRENGITCRMLKIYNMAHKVTGVSNYKVCKINNVWKMMG